VTDRGERLGLIAVELAPGRSLRTHDADLLRALAEQAAIAFRNARLAADLANQVAELDRRTGELLESRRRLITAADAELARLERSIAREVVPHLEPLPEALAELAAGAGDGLDGRRLESLMAAANAALESLREITRGVFPAQLARSGLEPALRSLLVRTGTGTLTVGTERVRRLDARVEAAAYFCVAEAVRDLGPPLTVDLRDLGTELAVVVSGCDQGELAVANLRDRVESAGGTVTQGTEDATTVLRVRLPAPEPSSAPAPSPATVSP
jgi:signal transduction histidine kinase